MDPTDAHSNTVFNGYARSHVDTSSNLDTRFNADIRPRAVSNADSHSRADSGSVSDSQCCAERGYCSDSLKALFAAQPSPCFCPAFAGHPAKNTGLPFPIGSNSARLIRTKAASACTFFRRHGVCFVPMRQSFPENPGNAPWPCKKQGSSRTKGRL